MVDDGDDGVGPEHRSVGGWWVAERSANREGMGQGSVDSGQQSSMCLEGRVGPMAARVIGWFSKCTVDGEREKGGWGEGYWAEGACPESETVAFQGLLRAQAGSHAGHRGLKDCGLRASLCEKAATRHEWLLRVLHAGSVSSSAAGPTSVLCVWFRVQPLLKLHDFSCLCLSFLACKTGRY